MAGNGDKKQSGYNAATFAALLCMLIAAVLGACAFRGTGPFMPDSQAQGASEAQSAGWVQVVSVKGNVDVQRAGIAMELLEGTRCCEGDVVTVRPGSQARLSVGGAGAVVLSEGMGAYVGEAGELKLFLTPDATGLAASPSGEAGAGASGASAGASAEVSAGTAAPKADAIGSCELQIRCDSILAHRDELQKGKDKYLPEDGMLLARQDVDLFEGETAFDVLRRVCAERGLQLEYDYTPVYDAYYVEGIGNLYERDCGRMSGWLFKVDGTFPNLGPSKLAVEPGQFVEWVFTCDGSEMDEGGQS